ncbi:MAG: universal stress protein [Candidatus Accumulibacter sp. UW26]|jgi:nucleotide-binding universal stress UspA family protein
MNPPGTPGGDADVVRILLPIDACDDSRWGIRYAIRRHRAGQRVEVILLNVGELISQWQVLRFYTEQELSRFQASSSKALIEDAAKPLREANIPCRGVFKQGEVAFAILDAAEELDCHEIAMPAPMTAWWNPFSSGVLLTVVKRQRSIPVFLVDRDGMPVKYPGH